MAPIQSSQPLFVVGPPRSGTTLAKALIGEVEGVYLLPDEFQVLGAFIRAARSSSTPESAMRVVRQSAFASHMRTRGLWPTDEILRETLAPSDPAESFRALVLLFAKLQGAPSPRYWGDKTPENAFELPLIRETWPNARVIAVVRDPRDTALSMNRSWGRGWLRSAVTWRDAMRAAEDHASVDRDSVLWLRYEEMITNPRAVVDGVALWLGSHRIGEALAGSETARAIDTGERWGRAAGAQGIVATPDRWRTSMSPRDVALVEAVCLEDMMRWGYPPEFATHPHAPGATALRLAKLADVVPVLRSYAKERGARAAIAYKSRQWWASMRSHLTRAT